MKYDMSNHPLQGSLDWHRARLGHFTGSMIGKLMITSRKKGEDFGDTAKSYLFKVAGERLLSENVVNDDELFALYLENTIPYSRAMQWGKDHEEEAKELYEKNTGNKVEPCPSVEHPTIDLFAASPDGYIEDLNRIVEVKCPNFDTAIRYGATITDAATLKSVNADYYWQMQAEMDCTSADSGDFIVYCPFLQQPLRVVNINKVPEDIELMHARIELAEAEVRKIMESYGGAGLHQGDNPAV